MAADLSDIRPEYRNAALNEADLNPDPIRQFDQWFNHAAATGLELPNAMALATAGEDGRPTVRYVLLKKYDAAGFVFYSHSVSLKGRQMAENPRAALVFYWASQHRQIRIEGHVEPMPAEDADEYFASRPYGSRLSAWIGPQSSSVDSRHSMEEEMAKLDAQYDGGRVPRPETWIGYRVRPDLMEFWQGRENRLHDRILYVREFRDKWAIRRLAP